jgi:SAM-dependent methyltransferase
MPSSSAPPRRTHHPIFARVYARIATAAEQAGAAEHRRKLLAGLQGRVAEVGAGTGTNFAYYPTEVSDVIALEPEAYLRTHAQRAAASAAVRVDVVEGHADAVPLADESVDAVVASLMLCSVPDQSSALAEMFRIVRPGGELRFYEHVAGPDGSRLAGVQKALDPVWTRLAGGCHLTRDTASAIRAAGFEVEECEHFLFQPCWAARITGPHIVGRARRPQAAG